MKAIQERAQVGDREISLETGKVAKQADGSIWIRHGDSIVLVTVVSAKERKEGIDFFPLTVDYQEKMFAAGKIPGNFFKREGRPTTTAILTARLTDRPLRPLFPKGYPNEVQVIITTFSIKESIFKAIDPIVQRYVGFHEAEVEILPHGDSHIALYLNTLHAPFEIDGRWQVFDSHVVTSVRLRPASLSDR